MIPCEKIRLITFDAGGTLLYPYPSVGRIYSEIIRKHGVDLDAQALDEGFRTAWKEAHLVPRVGITEEGEKGWWRGVVRRTLHGCPEPHDFDAFFDELWLAFAESHRWKLFEGSVETLSELKRRGFELALLSNWDHRLRVLIQGLDLAGFFTRLYISSEVGFEKPDPRIFRRVEEDLNLSSDTILHVGDSLYHDVQGAQKAGWNWVHLVHRPNADQQAGQISAIPDLLELIPGKIKNRSGQKP